MNLLADPWIPAARKSGSIEICAIADLVDDEIVEIVLPRADFKGAAYQMLVGILQTVMAPADKSEWLQFFHSPPERGLLQERLGDAAHAFQTTGDGPRFMQEFDELGVDGETSIAALLIDSPGENGVKNNTDFFVKRGRVDVMSWSMANLALFTLQINAPAGGQGIRTGLRGGGPITTLVTPASPNATLWQKLWINVINRRVWQYPDPDLSSPEIFPWLGPTKVSDKSGTEIYQADVHELCMYWAMPRRVRMEPISETTVCDVSGISSSSVVRHYRSKNQGNNYSGNWRHPLTAYKWDPKKPDAEHLSIKGQPGGINYKLWHVLTLSTTDKDAGQCAARVVQHYDEISDVFDAREVPRLWAFGYDMDNMKPRGWYSAELPLFQLAGVDESELLVSVQELQRLASDILFYTRSQIKSAWFESPSNAKGDMSFVDTAFWQRTESAFFVAVVALVQTISSGEGMTLTPGQARSFLQTLQDSGLALFDEYAFSDLGDARSTRKRVLARKQLVKSLYGSRSVKAFKEAMQLNSDSSVEAIRETKT